MALTTINSGGVKDDSIVNADIKSDAAIAGTKVAPDFGSQNIVTTGELTVDTNTLKVDATNNRVGIGTTSPGRTLDVNGIIRSDGTSSGLAIGGNSSTPSEGSAIHRPAASTLAFVTDSTERLRITSDGKVGIGEDAPNSLLHLGAADNSNHEAILTLNNGGASGNEAGIEWLYEASTTPRAKIWLDSSGQDLKFATANTERLQIELDGDFRIPFKDASNGLRQKIQWVTESPHFDEVAYLSMDRTATSSAPSDMVFATGPVGSVAERLRIASDGVSHFAGDVKVLTGDVIMGDGRGINFSADANAGGMTSETLDDYEEGTFTPTLQAYDGSSWGDVSLHAGTLYGRYTKIGNVVHISMYCYLFHVQDAHDSDGAAFTLPFTVTNASDSFAVLSSGHYNCFETTGHTNFMANANTTRAVTVKESSIYYNTWSGSNNRYLMVTGCYTTAS